MGFFGRMLSFFKKGHNLIILVFFIFSCLMAIVFRMKSIELDYELSKKRKEIKKISELNKELKAERAGEMSIESLSRLARTHKMSEPSQKQIIVVP